MHDEISLIDAADRAAVGRAYAEWREVETPARRRMAWRWGLAALVAVGALSWALAGAAAVPDGIHASGPRMHAMPADADCVARVAIYNLHGWYQKAETVQTDRGPVVIQYQTVGGHNAANPDRIDVLETPRGLFARPMSAEIADDGVLFVCLFEYVGG